MTRQALVMLAFCASISGTVNAQLGANTTLTLLSTGRFRSSSYVTYAGFSNSVPISVLHFIENSDANFAGPATTPFSKIITSSSAGTPPNCYRAKVYAQMTGGGETSADSANEYCYQGPPPPDGEGGDDQNHAPYEPLILDLNGDGIHTTRLEDDPVSFDLDADGVLDRTAWTEADSDDAFLWLDRNRNRVVDDGHELFGDATYLANGQKSQNGVELLAIYDDAENGGNTDGMIDKSDAVWNRLRLWNDRNHDGVMTPDENATLDSRAVLSISLSFSVVSRALGVDASGNWHFLQGVFRQRVILKGQGADIVDRAVHDVAFRVE